MLSAPKVQSSSVITFQDGEVVRITQGVVDTKTEIVVENKKRVPIPGSPQQSAPSIPLTWPAAFAPTSSQLADPELLKRALMQWNKARLDDEGVNYNLCSDSQFLDSELIDALLETHRTSLETLNSFAGRFKRSA
jgi:hypothetical protein